MSKNLPITRSHGLEAIELVSPDGARATIALHGAQVLSWIPAGGAEQLYLSPKSEFSNGHAIRGGVPVCFPQFAERGPLKKHGFARTKPWTLVSAEQGEHDALAVLRLADDPASRMVWPHAFEAELSVLVHGRSLQIELAVENRGEAGAEAFEFTTALHSYFAINDIDEASVDGLSGLNYLDSVDQTEKAQRVSLLLPSGELDRIYLNAKQDLTLKEQGISTQRELQISQQGFEDVVVWNPGAERAASLADLPDGDWRKYLCVEAATVGRPVRLEPGESWVGMQSLVLA
ncbi:D-hexose-6-phosphate mutarotase [Paucibacter sp. R3-3]|uniref:Putative glucose-6-phosphate 1-epimerase n=1 Tax=Roseateles agri TaxID=3098619 RepID=A0ABU5DFI0_9BURK|nr:D-hexose-6-phosphate mutarotase [Paucibacter sp. R3-3]MDY0745048.1 D-hexose-6-phosphate mutarotase [Paucibacter sp. R3-3]